MAKQTTADWVRENGWKVGDTIICRDLSANEHRDFTSAYTITAIGERHVLAKEVIHWGKPVSYAERLESFAGRGWELLQEGEQ